MCNKNTFSSAFLLGENLETSLFEVAINFAQAGLRVWFISENSFKKLPENVILPEKEVFELITFIYLEDYKSLLNHLNSTHLWHKIPNVVILNNFENYCNLYKNNYDPILSALISTTILDSMSVCSKKIKKQTFLVISCIYNELYRERLKTLNDLYFRNMSFKDESTTIVNTFLNEIKH